MCFFSFCVRLFRFFPVFFLSLLLFSCFVFVFCCCSSVFVRFSYIFSFVPPCLLVSLRFFVSSLFRAFCTRFSFFFVLFRSFSLFSFVFVVFVFQKKNLPSHRRSTSLFALFVLSVEILSLSLACFKHSVKSGPSRCPVLFFNYSVDRGRRREGAVLGKLVCCSLLMLWLLFVVVCCCLFFLFFYLLKC